MMLEVSDLHARFDTRDGSVHANAGVSFSVGRGERVGVVGESGSGKSVMIGTILGLSRGGNLATSGKAVFDGVDLMATRDRDLRRIRGRDIGFVAQNPFGALNPILPVERQFLNLVRAHRRAGAREVREQSREMLASVGIADPDRVLKGYAHELSGGMAQRVVIAMALMLDPKLVIADEPTTALDVTVQKQILELIKELIRSGNRSLLIVTHDLGVVANYCDAVVVMYSGTVVEQGSVASVFARPLHPYTLALLRAVPRKGRMPVALAGRLPDLRVPPRGCMFRARCPHAMPICETVRPELRAIGEGRRVACHLDVEKEVPALAAG
jgi:peptide/nickel transport system ATP-binding protein